MEYMGLWEKIMATVAMGILVVCVGLLAWMIGNFND